MAITTERIASGFHDPLYATAPPGDTGRLFVVEQHTGQIKIIDLAGGTTLATPFLTVPGVGQGGEQGLLGLAFHPDYASNGLFYVDLTNAAGDTEVREHKVSAGDPNVADPASGRTLLTIDQPFSNHNGGWLGFGPDDYLYVATGDGGSGGDPNNNAQTITGDLLGKILRIDVNGDAFPADPDRNYAIPATNPFVGATGDDEIWAYGLRNPWRPSFDRLTGDLYIADVGQGAREEVNFQPAASTGGENYGWKVLEGTSVFSSVPGNPPANDPSLVAPIHEYGHVGAPNGGNSITGGYVYRGSIPELQGLYFFADFVSRQIWSFAYDGATKTDFQNRTAALAPAVGSIANISSFAEDAAGNLYIIDYDGEIYQIVAGANLFTAGSDTIDFNTVIAGDYLDGSQHDALAGNDLVTLPNLANAAAAGFVIGSAFGGGTGNDTVLGGDGNDVILGADGNDSLAGNGGSDTLTGGAGNDVFGFAATGNGVDRIVDFGVGDDRIRIAGAALAGAVSEGPGTALAQNQVELAHAGGTSTLFIRTTAGSGPADIAIDLNGSGFTPANFQLSGTDIAFTLPPPELSLAASQVLKLEGTGGTTTFFFTVTRSVNATVATEVAWSAQGSGADPAAAADFSGGVLPSGIVAFAPGETVRQIQVPVNADTAFEADEGFTVTLANPTGGALLIAPMAGATILNDDLATVAIAASEAVKAEGDSDATAFRFTLTRSGDLSLAFSLDWSVLGNGATPADAGDFLSGTLPTGIASFAAGEAAKELVILVHGDSLIEPDEGFVVTLSDPTLGAAIATAQAHGTILNDDHTFLSIVATDAVKPEGNVATTPFLFLVLRSGDITVGSSVDYQVGFTGDHPTDAADFAEGTAFAGTVDFQPGEASKPITLNVVGDALNEADETFVVTLSQPVGAELAEPIAAGAIVRNDEPDLLPLVSIVGGEVVEGDDGTVLLSFTLTLAEAAADPVSVLATTADGSALAGSDYMGRSETVLFTPGETAKPFTVAVNGDTTLEGDERLLVVLSQPVNATLAVATASGTIRDDDPGAALLLDGVVFSDSGAGTARWGSALSDSLEGNGGNDSLMGLGQGDLLDGGSGDDLLLGDLAADGPDRLAGGDGNDIAIAGGGDDTLLGGGGADLLMGDAGSDTLLGGDGDDRLFGGGGGDYLWGDGGDDTLDGQAGADSLDGGAGDDQVAVDGADLYAGGGSGRDRLILVGGGIDAIDLGGATNQNAGAAGPRLQGFEEVDASLADGPVAVIGSAALGSGSQVIGSVVIGSRFADTLTGGAAGDTLIGGGGADTLAGGEGADDLVYLGLGTDDIAIAGFAVGSDRIVLDPALGLSPAMARAQTHAVGADAVLDLGQGGSITLIGLAALLPGLSESDFAVL